MPEITIEEVEGDAAQAVDLLSDSHWRDLAPLPYPPLPQPVVEIDMDEETALLMGRFWAVKTAGVCVVAEGRSGEGARGRKGANGRCTGW